MEEKGERMRFSVAPGVAGIMRQAKKDERHEEHTVHLTGDLCQMAAQSTFLKNLGVDVQFNNVYPCVKECDQQEKCMFHRSLFSRYAFLHCVC